MLMMFCVDVLFIFCQFCLILEGKSFESKAWTWSAYCASLSFVNGLRSYCPAALLLMSLVFFSSSFRVNRNSRTIS